MTSSRHTTAALDKLESVLQSSIKDVERLLGRVSDVRARLETGESLSELLDASERPLIIESLSVLLDRLGDASSALRRAEAQQLFAEGFTRTRIAAMFGVSRQRATTLLSRGRGTSAASKGRRDAGR
jgi:DNA-directed RNA polymerase specialized sigma24 family protein